MSTRHLLPNESTTEYMAHNAIKETVGIRSFIDGLTEEQKRRFCEIAHHLVHVGFETGTSRRDIEPSDSAKERILVQETTLFLKGAGELAEELER